MPVCPQCRSTRLYKDGLRYLTDAKSAQRWLCRDCRYRFTKGTEEEWVGLAVEAGLAEKDATRLFESLNGSELFWQDRDGRTIWRWFRE